MKKLLLLCFMFVFSTSFYAQETAVKPKKVKVEKTAKDPKVSDADKEAKKAEAKAKRDAKKAEKVATAKATTTAPTTVTDADKEAKKAAAKAKRDAKKAEKDAKAATVPTATTPVKTATTTPTPKKVVKEKQSNEKAPAVTDKVTGEYNGHKIMTGPRGGRYYINKNGNKTYISDDK